MVSTMSIANMVISLIATLAVVIISFIYFYKKEKITIKPVLIGAGTFILFSQVLEKILHFIVINNKIFTNPLAFAIYGALAAGIFEEGGRFIAFKTLLKNKHQWKDGIAFGIGQGGIEAILVGVLSTINYLVISSLINAGTFEQTLGAAVPAKSLAQLKGVLTGPSSMFLAIGIERIFAFAMQIGLTMVVLYGVRHKKNLYLLLAMLLHALMDVPAALYQTGFFKNVWLAELTFFAFAIIAVLYIKRSKKSFSD